MTSLESLMLRDNLLTTLPVEIIGLPSLNTIDIENNHICTETVTDASVATWIQSLDPLWPGDQLGCL